MSAAPTAAAVVADQFAGRTRAELEAMCQLRGLPASAGDDAARLRQRLRADVMTRRREDPAPRVVAPTADRDTAARMALIDREVREHFAASPDPIAARAIAAPQPAEVLLSVQRLRCPRLTDGRYGPPSNPDRGDHR